MRSDAQLAAEIRAPLAGIIELADLLLESGVTDQQREYALKLKAAAAEVLRRVEARVSSLGACECYEFPIRDAVHKAVACSRTMSRSPGASIAVAFDPGVPETAVGDGRRMMYLVAEMAAAASADEPALTVSIEPVHTLVLKIETVDPEANAWLASELACCLGGELRTEIRADGAAAYVARVPVTRGRVAGV